MTQWEKRVQLFQYLYSCLLLDATPEEILNNHLTQDFEFDADWLRVIEYIAEHFSEIQAQITQHLASSWTFERIPYVDKAVMFAAVGEFQILNTPKAVVIDQALITAKHHTVDDSYKYINAILQKIL